MKKNKKNTLVPTNELKKKLKNIINFIHRFFEMNFCIKNKNGK